MANLLTEMFSYNSEIRSQAFNEFAEVKLPQETLNTKATLKEIATDNNPSSLPPVVDTPRFIRNDMKGYNYGGDFSSYISKTKIKPPQMSENIKKNVADMNDDGTVKLLNINFDDQKQLEEYIASLKADIKSSDLIFQDPTFTKSVGLSSKDLGYNLVDIKPDVYIDKITVPDTKIVYNPDSIRMISVEHIDFIEFYKDYEMKRNQILEQISEDILIRLSDFVDKDKIPEVRVSLNDFVEKEIPEDIKITIDDYESVDLEGIRIDISDYKNTEVEPKRIDINDFPEESTLEEIRIDLNDYSSTDAEIVKVDINDYKEENFIEGKYRTDNNLPVFNKKEIVPESITVPKEGKYREDNNLKPFDKKEKVPESIAVPKEGKYREDYKLPAFNESEKVPEGKEGSVDFADTSYPTVALDTGNWAKLDTPHLKRDYDEYNKLPQGDLVPTKTGMYGSSLILTKSIDENPYHPAAAVMAPPYMGITSWAYSHLPGVNAFRRENKLTEIDDFSVSLRNKSSTDFKLGKYRIDYKLPAFNESEKVEQAVDSIYPNYEDFRIMPLIHDKGVGRNKSRSDTTPFINSEKLPYGENMKYVDSNENSKYDIGETITFNVYPDYAGKNPLDEDEGLKNLSLPKEHLEELYGGGIENYFANRGLWYARSIWGKEDPSRFYENLSDVTQYVSWGFLRDPVYLTAKIYDKTWDKYSNNDYLYLLKNPGSSLSKRSINVDIYDVGENGVTFWDMLQGISGVDTLGAWTETATRSLSLANHIMKVSSDPQSIKIVPEYLLFIPVWLAYSSIPRPYTHIGVPSQSYIDASLKGDLKSFGQEETDDTEERSYLYSEENRSLTADEKAMSFKGKESINRLRTPSNRPVTFGTEMYWNIFFSYPEGNEKILPRMPYQGWIPVKSYNLQSFRSGTKSQQTMAGNVTYLDMYELPTTISMDIPETCFMDVDHWLRSYFACIYGSDEAGAVAAKDNRKIKILPYKKQCMYIKIAWYTPHWDVIRTKKFICIPNFEFSYKGVESADIKTIELTFSIVGTDSLEKIPVQFAQGFKKIGEETWEDYGIDEYKKYTGYVTEKGEREWVPGYKLVKRTHKKDIMGKTDKDYIMRG